MFYDQHLLGSRHVSWNSVKFMTAWRAGFKLGKSLIAFQFPKPVRKRDSSSTSGTRTPEVLLATVYPLPRIFLSTKLQRSLQPNAAAERRRCTEATTPQP
jgi:hypothetical protein